MPQQLLGPIGRSFLAFGGVWVDEIRLPGEQPRRDVLGGSVVWATLGARLFSGDNSGSVAMAPCIGNDFPPALTRTIEEWNLDLHWIQHADLPTPRGIVEYQHATDHSKRIYHRITEPMDLTPQLLANVGGSLASAVHFFDVPAAIEEQVPFLLQSQMQHAASQGVATTQAKLLVVWEPQAKSCSPATLQDHFRAAKLADVFSPNHSELGKLFGNDNLREDDRHLIESYANIFVESGIGVFQHGCIVVRAASQGCLVASRSNGFVWLPAYHQLANSIVDPTGAGNTFLGGFAVGLLETGRFVPAAAYGTVAASFAVEQIGVPRLSTIGGIETWNGVSVRRRLQEYRERIDLRQG